MSQCFYYVFMTQVVSMCSRGKCFAKFSFRKAFFCVFMRQVI
jgi:hypothetical protein